MDRASRESSLVERETHNKAAKEKIAQFISQLVRNGESIMIDGGSTTHEIARMLHSKRNLFVVTNSPAIADELLNGLDNQVIVTGGQLREITRVTSGPLAEYTVRQFHVDRVILGMSSLMADEGLFTVNPAEAELKRAMMKCGKEIIVAIDSSKFGKRTLSFVSDFSMVGKLITDGGATPDDIQKIEQNGVEVITV